MLGSTIAYIPEANMPARVDELEDLFDCPQVGFVLLTLDFVTACQAAEIYWFGGEPKLFDNKAASRSYFPYRSAAPNIFGHMLVGLSGSRPKTLPVWPTSLTNTKPPACLKFRVS